LNVDGAIQGFLLVDKCNEYRIVFYNADFVNTIVSVLIRKDH